MMVSGASPIYAGIYQHRGDDPRHVEVLPADVRPPKVLIGIFILKNRTIGRAALCRVRPRSGQTAEQDKRIVTMSFAGANAKH
jgi:hypothetical protein